MKRFTPSELPICTVIDDQLYGTFMKDAPGIWAEVQYHCKDCQETVYDEGPTVAQKIHAAYAIDRPSDEYFTDFKILSWPNELIEKLADDMRRLTGGSMEYHIQENIKDLEK
jgi:hypothetical protein